MRPCLLVSLHVLLTCFLLVDVQGIRLEKEFQSVLVNQRIQEEKIKSRLIGVNEENGGSVEELILCKDGHCSSGNSRKLLTKETSTSTSSTSTTTTTTTPTKKNEKFGRMDVDSKSKRVSSERLGEQKEKVSVVESSHQEAVGPARYPDIIDIAGMDYTTARRKPPIHN
ncbi:hypothetical protein BVC80_517g13 [Macleaya cordata]|uniref:Uncharacterized protein n=1 Tax=Macleaya cordata TaxID=56857 RepID=A0A200PYM0_MACCD|nr:hypothetical protein BVC80_517g13 [Macleaya cordata]